VAQCGVRALVTDYKGRLAILCGFIGVMWLSEIVDTVLFGGALDLDGIYPRDVSWLWGILLAPFLHGGFAHLIANTVPLFVLGWLVIVRRRMDFFLVTAIVTILGGLGVWLFGRPGTVHFGASGVVFGYLGYLFFRAWFERSLASMAIALVAALLYGGALWGVLPTRSGVSWEGHLFGFAGGAATARIWGPSRRQVPDLKGQVTL
jgi:membrane associated rhomboid family serine protease